MAHFAELDGNNTVLRVIVVGNEDIQDDDGVEQESIGVAFCQNLFGSDTNWKQTSYNANMRKNYAAMGFTYDASRDAFIPPQPFASWTLDETICDWVAPVAHPNDGDYYWNEDVYQADTNDPKTAGWVAV